jgi:hypothetical protein
MISVRIENPGKSYAQLDKRPEYGVGNACVLFGAFVVHFANALKKQTVTQIPLSTWIS